MITICPLLPSVKKHYEVTVRRECAEIFFLLNMFIVLRIKNGTLWTPCEQALYTVKSQKLSKFTWSEPKCWEAMSKFNNVDSCDFCFLFNTALQMFISQTYWKHLFGCICFVLFSYPCSLFSLFSKASKHLDSTTEFLDGPHQTAEQ